MVAHVVIVLSWSSSNINVHNTIAYPHSAVIPIKEQKVLGISWAPPELSSSSRVVGRGVVWMAIYFPWMRAWSLWFAALHASNVVVDGVLTAQLYCRLQCISTARIYYTTAWRCGRSPTSAVVELVKRRKYKSHSEVMAQTQRCHRTSKVLVIVIILGRTLRDTERGKEFSFTCECTLATHRRGRIYIVSEWLQRRHHLKPIKFSPLMSVCLLWPIVYGQSSTTTTCNSLL